MCAYNRFSLWAIRTPTNLTMHHAQRGQYQHFCMGKKKKMYQSSVKLHTTYKMAVIIYGKEDLCVANFKEIQRCF